MAQTEKRTKQNLPEARGGGGALGAGVAGGREIKKSQTKHSTKATGSEEGKAILKTW